MNRKTFRDRMIICVLCTCSIMVVIYLGHLQDELEGEEENSMQVLLLEEENSTDGDMKVAGDLWSYAAEKTQPVDKIPPSQEGKSQSSAQSADGIQLQASSDDDNMVTMSKGINDVVTSTTTPAQGNIIINDVLTDDVMPAYFNMTYEDMVPQYAKYINETEAIMGARRDRVSTYCTKHGRTNTRANFFYQMPNNLTYCAVFKAGSTNWKQFYCQIYFPEEYQELGPKIDTERDWPYCQLSFLKKYRANSKHPVPPATTGELRYLTVRHPYERLVSAYSNKFKECPKGEMFKDGLMLDILREYRVVNASLSVKEKAELLELARLECWKPLDERIIDPQNPYLMPLGPTFVEFIKMVISNFLAKKRVGNDSHWLPSAELCALCNHNVQYKIIEKFETLERDHHFLLSKLGHLELLPLIASVHTNPSHKDSTVYDYFKLLDETQLWHLSQMYMADFELFGYKPHYSLRNKPSELL